MRENFDRCLDFVLHGDRRTWMGEGGYVDHPKDPGGPTNMGITIATLSHELGRRATRTDVRNMTVATAASIYRKKYWNLMNCDALPGGVDLMLFDVAVNSGPGRAMQFDDQSEKAGSPTDRVLAIDRLRVGFWKRCRNKSGQLLWPIFGKGWMNREKPCLALALKLAGG